MMSMPFLSLQPSTISTRLGEIDHFLSDNITPPCQAFANPQLKSNASTESKRPPSRDTNRDPVHGKLKTKKSHGFFNHSSLDSKFSRFYSKLRKSFITRNKLKSRHREYNDVHNDDHNEGASNFNEIDTLRRHLSPRRSISRRSRDSLHHRPSIITVDIDGSTTSTLNNPVSVSDVLRRYSVSRPKSLNGTLTSLEEFSTASVDTPEEFGVSGNGIVTILRDSVVRRDAASTATRNTLIRRSRSRLALPLPDLTLMVRDDTEEDEEWDRYIQDHDGLHHQYRSPESNSVLERETAIEEVSQEEFYAPDRMRIEQNQRALNNAIAPPHEMEGTDQHPSRNSRRRYAFNESLQEFPNLFVSSSLNSPSNIYPSPQRSRNIYSDLSDYSTEFTNAPSLVDSNNLHQTFSNLVIERMYHIDSVIEEEEERQEEDEEEEYPTRERETLNHFDSFREIHGDEATFLDSTEPGTVEDGNRDGGTLDSQVMGVSPKHNIASTETAGSNASSYNSIMKSPDYFHHSPETVSSSYVRSCRRWLRRPVWPRSGKWQQHIKAEDGNGVNTNDQRDDTQ